MTLVAIETLNALASAWAGAMWRSLVEGTALLVIIWLAWLLLRRRASSAFLHGLFLLVLIKHSHKTDAEGRWQCSEVPADLSKTWFRFEHPDFARMTPDSFQPTFKNLGEEHYRGAIQPTFKSLAEEHYKGAIADMMKTDMELIEAESNLAVLEQALQRSKEENGQRGLPSDGKPEPLIEEEFRKDPEVAVLIREITEVENHLERAKGKARQPNDPAVIAADKHLSKWMLRYEKLWKIQYEKIRQRLWDVFGPVADEKLEPLIEDEFRRDPEVADVIREVTEARDQLEHTKGMAKQPNDPAVIAIHKQHAKLMDRYENLWKIKYKEILQRLRDVSGPTPSSINELRLKVAAMKNKKERQTKNFEKMQPQFKNKE